MSRAVRLSEVKPSRAIVWLRFVVAMLLAAHGVARWTQGGVPPFGEFLTGQGMPFGVAIAWAITVWELVAGLVLAAGRWVAPIAVVFIAILGTGIALVHAPNGWFVVGLGRNGVEYSVLLIASLLALIIDTWERSR